MLGGIGGRRRRGRQEDEMAGWHHWLDGREFEWTPGVGDGQGGLACCNSWGCKESARLSNFTFTFHFHALEKEMATHSSILAWRIPGTEEPGELLSMGTHRVGHNWSNLAAEAMAARCIRCRRASDEGPTMGEWGNRVRTEWGVFREGTAGRLGTAKAGTQRQEQSHVSSQLLIRCY